MILRFKTLFTSICPDVIASGNVLANFFSSFPSLIPASSLTVTIAMVQKSNPLTGLFNRCQELTLKHMKPILKFLLLILICEAIVSDTVVAQQHSGTTLENQFRRYTTSTLQEKVFVHTDKNTYLTGEIVWFGTYIMEAFTNSRIDISKVAYIEILNAESNPVLQTKVDIKDGFGNGSVSLPSTLPSGNYTLRAYTSWMKNFSPDLYFHKPLTIFNTLKNEEFADNKKKEAGYQIQFFPEGGDLVTGLRSKVAFRAIDNSGKGIRFKGFILNQKNDTVARFKPTKFGIGTLSLLAEKDMLYRAIIIPDGGTAFSRVLPAVTKLGFVMQFTKQPDGNYKLIINSSTADEHQLKAVIYAGYAVNVNKTLVLNDGKGEVIITKDQMPEGVSRIAIFNEANKPIAERLYFRKPTKALQIGTELNKAQFTKRERVSLSIQNKDETNHALSSIFSVSVSLTDSLENESENLQSFAWLTSELKGKVENPDYYLNSNDEEAQDNLMLTHGWRRFKWENIQKESTMAVKYLPEVQGHIITGKIVNSSSNTPVGHKTGYLSVPGRRLQFYVGNSNNSGDIRFLTKDLKGSEELMLQTNPLTDSILRIELISPFSTEYSNEKPIAFNYTKSLSESLRKRSIAMQVDKAFSGELLEKESLPVIDTIPFYLPAKKLYQLDKYVRFPTMEEVLREYIPEIFVESRKKSYRFKVLNTDTKSFYEDSPLMLVDGVPVFNGNDIIGLDPLKVESLEVLDRPYIYGPERFSGIANFKTYKGDLSGLKINPYATVFDYEGTQLQREFYSPMYEGEQKNSRTPDLRNTLYWLPAQKSDKNGLSSINFYTSDLPGKYKVLIQGLSDNARIGVKVITFEVK
jgi:hypothetical protein